ncbi:MAG: inositol monophosphatase, partial [Actinobacteria bacterium]|nr:inositol monophosphatase [Actinomycetota bacterium]
MLGTALHGDAVAKGEGDYVTEVDHAAEALISQMLTSDFPDIPIQAEEGGGSASERYWCVDPLDGTTNFIHGFPAVGVSIALIEDGRPTVGVVHAPFLAQTYVAQRGKGAFLRDDQGDHPLHVSTRVPQQSVLATG